MTAPVDYGVLFNDKSDDLMPALTTDMSTVFLIGTSEDATPAIIPVNVTRMFNSSDIILLANVGTGNLATGLQLINAQLGQRQLAAVVQVHRVAKGASDAETIANIIGSQAAGTGIYASLAAGEILTRTPRLLTFCDGLTGVFTRAAGGKVVTRLPKFGGNAGTGLMTLAAPAFGADVKAGVYRVRCKTAAADGGDFSVVDPDGLVLPEAAVGVAYAGDHVRFTITDGETDFTVGDGFDVTVTVTVGQASANPICAALPQVLNALQARAVVSGPGTTVQDDLDWRETLSSKRLIPVSTWVTPVGFADGTFFEPGPLVAGCAVAIDAQTRGSAGVPSQSFANWALNGITALKRYDSFSTQDGANDGQLLLNNNVGIIQRGQIGVDGAVGASGFKLICYATAAGGLDRMINVGRTQDYAELQILKVWRERLGVSNITRQSIQDFENDADLVLGRLKTDEHIIDFRTGVGLGNTPETIRAGRYRFKLQQEPASPFLVAEADVHRYRDALIPLTTGLATATNAVLAS